MREARVVQTDAGRRPEGEGWFILNLAEASWDRDPDLGIWCDIGAEDVPFAQFGIGPHMLMPGQPNGRYHAESAQEGFLVLSGECIAIIEGQERRLHRWDFVHCPPGTKHAFVGVGEEPCVLLCASSRQFQKDGPWGYYCYDETAERYNAASPEDTQDGEIAYGRFPESQEARYPGGLLPE